MDLVCPRRMRTGRGGAEGDTKAGDIHGEDGHSAIEKKTRDVVSSIMGYCFQHIALISLISVSTYCAILVLMCSLQR